MAKELVYKIRIDYDASQAAKGGQVIENTQENAAEATKKTTQQINRQAEAQEKASQSTRSYQRNQSRANQVLFTYGDLVNDAQQFQFGFSNGLRAIGNNVSFAAEGISNLSTNAGGLVGAFKTLGSSLLGPGGLILVINLAVTAFTVFGDKLFGDSDSVAARAEEAQKSIADLRKEIDRFGPQFEQLTQLQEQVFPDISQIQALRQQVQFAIELEANLQNRLDVREKEVKQLKEQVNEEARLLEILNSNISASAKAQQAREEGLVTQQQAEKIAQGRVDIQATANKLTAQLNNSQNRLNDAKIEQKSLETSVQSAQERQINLNAKLLELVEGQKTASFQALQNLINANDRIAGIQQTTAFDIAEVGGEGQDPISSLADRTARLPEVFRNTSDRIKEIKRQEVQARIGLERQAFSTISALAQAVAPRNKALALSLIAIEKGLKIAQVVSDGIQKAAAATTQGLLYLANPATAPLAGQAFSAAASIKAATAAAAGLIAAQGLAEGATAVGRIRGGGGGSGGGGSRQTAQEGFRTGTIDRGQATSGIQGATGSTQPINITLQTEADNKIIRKKSMQGKKEIESSVTANVETD